ncbi:MAG TPA: TIGR03435 family protein [Terracidiphilus sp.]
MACKTTNLPSRLGLSAVLSFLFFFYPANTLFAQSTPLPPMPADANPAFEVATIKPSDTSAPHGTFIRHNGRRIIAYNISLGLLITYAYSLHAKQIVNGSPTLLTSHFDIDGVPDIDGHPNINQTRLMFQKLLVSRFKLAFHYESRELPVYAIQLAKNGSKLTPTTRKAGDSTEFTHTCEAVLTVRNYSVADVAKGMQEVFLDKPVVDQTGLHDRYDFDLKWTPDDSQIYCPADPARARDDPNAPPGLYTAIQEQLGLKIVLTKAPIQVMVIDHAETPSEN